MPAVVRKARGYLRPKVRAVPRQARSFGRRAVALAEVSRAQTYVERKDYARAEQILSDLLKRYAGTKSALGLQSQVMVKQGRFDEAAVLSNRLAELSGKPEDRARARALMGRLVETDPGWLPYAGEPRPLTDPEPGRVLYLAKESMPYFHNGFCTRTHETLKSVQGAGLDPVAVTMPGFPATVGRHAKTQVSRVEGIRYRHVLPYSATLQSLPYDEYLQLSAQVLTREVAALRPELLHIGSGHRGYETALVGRALAAWSGLPWLYEVRSFFETTWTDDERYMESGPYFHRRYGAETRSMQAADMVVTLSGPMRDEIVSGHGVDPSRVVVIPNAVDLERFEPEERDAALRDRLGLTGKLVLGYISNLDHHREAQEVLLEATARLRARGLDAAVLLVGDGRRRPELEQRAADLGLGANAVFTGSVPFGKVAQYYSQIDLFVVPRINERAGRLVSPMKPFEAMAMNVPLVVSDLPALVEIAGAGERAEVFRAGDPDSLAAVAERLLSSPEALAGMAERARAWVAVERTWAACGRAFADAYEQAKDNHARRATGGR
ncbi:MAG: glycosyltransferase family 4 protein [Candidatus Nanopelagicales bacterium]